MWLCLPSRGARSGEVWRGHGGVVACGKFNCGPAEIGPEVTVLTDRTFSFLAINQVTNKLPAIEPPSHYLRYFWFLESFAVYESGKVQTSCLPTRGGSGKSLGVFLDGRNRAIQIENR